VHGSLVQQAEHGQLKHSGPVTTAHDSPTPPVAHLPPLLVGETGDAIPRIDVSNRYIAKICPGA
jgi:hypothetical protein